MGTRSTIHIYDERDKHLVSIYQQFDGYWDGVGKELHDFIKNGTLGNGISGNPKPGQFFNGMGCFAAQLIAKFKTRVGGLYITHKDDSQEFDYKITSRDGNIILEGTDGEDWKQLFPNPSPKVQKLLGLTPKSKE